MHRRVLVPALAMCVAIATLAGPAAAAQRPSAAKVPPGVDYASTPPTVADNCRERTDIHPGLQGDKPRRGLCLQRRPAAGVAKNGAPRIATALGPGACADGRDGAWSPTRTDTCLRTGGTLFLVEDIVVNGVPGRRILGTMDIIETLHSSTSAGSGRWTMLLGIQVVRATGVAVEGGVVVSGRFSCVYGCTTALSVFPTVELRTSQLWAEGTFDTTVAGRGQFAWAVTRVDYTFSVPSVPNAFPADTFLEMSGVRCDDAVPGNNTLPGCVVPAVTPTFYLSSVAFPEVAAHVAAAQASGLPATLNRLTDQTFRDLNRAQACPPRRPHPGDEPLDLRPSCDEYPFASTYQGAYIVDPNRERGRTFPWCGLNLPTRTGPGWSACLVPLGQNSRSGSALNSFYMANRVIDADPFHVAVT